MPRGLILVLLAALFLAAPRASDRPARRCVGA
jgi:hypothetical protein